MLSLEYLLEEAKNNGLPIVKTRGILREYLQIIILNAVYKHELARSIFFTGGTAMRFFYNMPRFSEDLDFDILEITPEEFTGLLEHVKAGLLNEGFSADISTEKRKELYIAEIYFRDLMKIYKITGAKNVDLMIKIEMYKPPWGIQSEPGVISLYGYNFSACLLEKSCIFSEKICALIKRTRGRDIYDTLFMLKKKFPINEDILKANNISDSPKEAILGCLRGLSEKKIKFLSDQVEPFLFKEEDTALVLKAVSFAEKFLQT